MSISTATMTAVCLGTTTYAWFARNGDAVVENTKFNLESAEGLRISIDGENYSQDITLSQLKEVIKAKTGKEYEDTVYNGVTLKHDNNGDLVFDTDGNPLFEKDSLELITDDQGNVTKEDVKYIEEHSINDIHSKKCKIKRKGKKSKKNLITHEKNNISKNKAENSE